MIGQSAQRLLTRVNSEASHTERFSPSIFMVPSVLRDLSPSSFNPQLVSIGPLHREDVSVQAFEAQKSSYLHKLISMLPTTYTQLQILGSCMERAYDSMNRIKARYVWTKTYSDDEIAEMMVIDACFILGFLIEVHNRSINTDNSDESYPGNELQFQSIAQDLVLLENQIPMFFLHQIFQCTVLKFRSDISLFKLILPVISHSNLFVENLRFDHIDISTTHHILSLLQQCYSPPNNIKEDYMGSSIHSAIDLDMAGVSLKPSKDPTWVMSMEVKRYQFLYIFGSWGKPVLTMPVLRVHDSSEFILRNLIAYEQLFQIKTYVTSYALAMDMLVNTHKDVVKLVESRVLVNLMGSHEEAAQMINSVCKNVPYYFFYKGEWEKLNKYCSGYWPKHIARMRRTYFSSPWSIIALLAGIILFVLQVVQTIFTIKYSGSNK